MIYCTKCRNPLEENQSICFFCYTVVETVDTPKEIIIPKRTKITKKNMIVSVFLVMTLFGGVFLGFIFTYPSLEHQEGEADYWRGEYYDLQDGYDNLQEDYDALLLTYSDLFADYEAIEGLYEDPMTSHIVPTANQVIYWLATDNTDYHSYIVGEYMCGDFSVMLTMRARLMNWRMRVCGMSYSFSGDPEYGNSNQFGEQSHAFNLIFVQDGSDPDSELDVLFIEPQTDKTWKWYDGSGNSNLFYIFITYPAMTYTVWDSTFWVNSGSYHG